MPSALILAIGLSATALCWVRARGYEEAETRRAFVVASTAVEASVNREVRAYLEILEALASHAAADFPPTGESFTRFVRDVLPPGRYGAIDGVMLLELVDAAGTPALEARVRADGQPDFRVRAAPDAAERLVFTRFVATPDLTLDSVLGVDVLSLSGGRLLSVGAKPEPVVLGPQALARLGLPPTGATDFMAEAPIFDRGGHARYADADHVVGSIVAPIDGARFLTAMAGAPESLALTLSVASAGQAPEVLTRVPAAPTAPTAPATTRVRRTTFATGSSTWFLEARDTGRGVAPNSTLIVDLLGAGGVLLTLTIAAAVLGRRRSSRRTRMLADDVARRDRWTAVLLEAASDPLMVLDAGYHVVYANRAANELFLGRRGEGGGRTAAEFALLRGIVGRLDDVRAEPGRRARFVTRTPGGSGRWSHVEFRIANLLDDPAIGGITLTARDISEHKQLEAVLQREARLDPLTGLANRAYFQERLRAALAPGPGPALVCVLFVDLDGFKELNDEFGHAAGDALLRAVAARFGSALRASDTVARAGGDEFLVLCEGLTDSDQATAIAQKLEDVLRTRLTIAGVDLAIRGSVGVIVANRWASPDPDAIVHAADQAMYRAKRLRRERATTMATPPGAPSA